MNTKLSADRLVGGGAGVLHQHFVKSFFMKKFPGFIIRDNIQGHVPSKHLTITIVKLSKMNYLVDMLLIYSDVNIKFEYQTEDVRIFFLGGGDGMDGLSQSSDSFTD